MKVNDIWLQVGVLAEENLEVAQARAVEHCRRGCERLGMNLEELKIPCRKREVIDIKKACCLFLRERGFSLKHTGEVIGGMDHATVLHHQNSAKELLKYDKSFKSKYNQFCQA